MNLEHLYQTYFEPALTGRYISPKKLQAVLDKYLEKGSSVAIGFSENGLPIYKIEIGNGPQKVLAWSQMHGNETTTTKSLMDFINILDSLKGKEASIDSFFEKYTLLAIPMLNPDGALAYTRENANMIDLNRDAKQISQQESKLLRKVFEEFKPDLCLNLHGQRTLYGLPNDKPATISFLSPAADDTRSLTPSRMEAMKLIAYMNNFLQTYLPGQIGRYDDAFNENCVGDQFQMAGVPTILFEAGHYQGDYQREITRKYMLYAYLALFEITNKPSFEYGEKDYFKIPENEKNFRDVILRNVHLNGKNLDIALQFIESLKEDAIEWVAAIDCIGECEGLNGHREMDFEGNEILINSNENVFVGEKVATISDKKLKKIIKL